MTCSTSCSAITCLSQMCRAPNRKSPRSQTISTPPIAGFASAGGLRYSSIDLRNSSSFIRQRVYIHTDHSQLLGQVCSALLPHKTPPSKRLFCRLRYCSFDKRERPHALSSLRFAPGACPPHGLLTLGRIRCSLFAYLTLHTQSRLSHRQQRTLVLIDSEGQTSGEGPVSFRCLGYAPTKANAYSVGHSDRCPTESHNCTKQVPKVTQKSPIRPTCPTLSTTRRSTMEHTGTLLQEFWKSPGCSKLGARRHRPGPPLRPDIGLLSEAAVLQTQVLVLSHRRAALG